MFWPIFFPAGLAFCQQCHQKLSFAEGQLDLIMLITEGPRTQVLPTELNVVGFP